LGSSSSAYLNDSGPSRNLRSSGANDESEDDSEATDDQHADGKRSSYYVFDEWLVSNSRDKVVDIFGEEARLPILFLMLIKILVQGT
jgi:hypothetical protein